MLIYATSFYDDIEKFSVIVNVEICMKLPANANEP